MAYTLSLEDAFQKALDNDVSIHEAKLTWLANRNNKGIAFSYLLPQIDSNFTSTKNKTNYKSCTTNCEKIKKSYHQNLYSFSLSQELFNMQTYFQFSKANQKGTQDLLIYQKALQNLALSIATKYFNLILSIEDYLFLTFEYEETKKREQNIQNQVSLGAMTKSQLLEAKAQSQRIQADIIQAKIAIFNAKDILSDSIGFDQFSKIKGIKNNAPLLTLTLPSLDYWLEDATQKNLDIQIANSDIIQADYEKKAMLSQSLPTFQFKSSYNDYRYKNQSISNDSNNSFVFPQSDNHSIQGSISLSLPIFNGKRNHYKQNKSNELLKLSKTQKKDIKQTVTREIKRLHRQIDHNQKIIQARKAAIQSSQEMLRIAKISLESGTITVLETLENITNVRKDRQNLEKSKYNHVLNLIEILIQTGNISPREIENINQNLQQTIQIEPA